MGLLGVLKKTLYVELLVCVRFRISGAHGAAAGQMDYVFKFFTALFLLVPVGNQPHHYLFRVCAVCRCGCTLAGRYKA